MWCNTQTGPVGDSTAPCRLLTQEAKLLMHRCRCAQPLHENSSLPCRGACHSNSILFSTTGSKHPWDFVRLCHRCAVYLQTAAQFGFPDFLAASCLANPNQDKESRSRRLASYVWCHEGMGSFQAMWRPFFQNVYLAVGYTNQQSPARCLVKNRPFIRAAACCGSSALAADVPHTMK